MSDLRRLLLAAPTLWKVGVADIVAYRAQMVIWILSATLPLVMLALWNAATEGAPVGAFGPTEVTRYFAATLVVRQLTGAWVMWELNYEIRTGALSPMLLRPVNPLAFNFAETLAAIPWRVLVLVPIVGVLLAWRPEAVAWPGVARAGLFVLSVGLAFLVSWLVQVVFGLAAFWIEQSMGLFSVYFSVWAMLSGYIIPSALLPSGLVHVVPWLPFYATLGAPVDLLTGGAPLPAAAVLGVQATWVVGLALLAGVLWRAGIRRYGAVGA